MEMPTEEEIQRRQEEIRQKRIATLVGAYDFMKSRYRDVAENTRIHPALVATTVEDYLRDRQALVARHNITGRIQRHKVAGMMAAAIVKHKPIQLLDSDCAASRVSKDNETLAVLHGMAICAEGRKREEIVAVLHTHNFHIWFSDFVYLLGRHPSNTESFILIFGTLSLAFFPEVLDRGHS